MSSARTIEPRNVSGIYPHLAMFNSSGECGTGAVVPWADRLWVTTYAPHKPAGSDDKLYEIDRGLNRVTRSESVGGTPACRMIHRESNQLFIGPYAIDGERRVRVIAPQDLPGRLTGIARSIASPEGDVWYATMEEGFYEVDVRSLDVRVLFPDANALGYGKHAGPLLPGYHGKGFYSGQGRYIYANNGEFSSEAMRIPGIESGALAEYDPVSEEWKVVRRNQFTDVTGPGGIEGSVDPENDPVWSIGWDHRSLLLMVLEEGGWSTYRLPKGSHCYDGAHGWNTEWPRIRDIGEDDLMMTMHGLFWRFPRGFRSSSSLGIEPRAAYLKVVGDFCRWGDRVVLACDDTAANEFNNKRRCKGPLKGPGVSHSNLWFVEPASLDRLGPPIARGAVWLDDDVRGGEASDAFLFNGFDRRGLTLSHKGPSATGFTIELDRTGSGEWTEYDNVVVTPRSPRYIRFPSEASGAWIRLRCDQDCPSVIAQFDYSSSDDRSEVSDPIFSEIPTVGDRACRKGLLWVLDRGRRSLGVADPEGSGCYVLNDRLELHHADDGATRKQILTNAPLVADVLRIDRRSALYVDDDGRRWRLPKGDPALAMEYARFPSRIDREVVTERDLFNCSGTFYELPSRNAGGFAKVRPVATHNRTIFDYCSYRGLVVLSGLSEAAEASDHVVVSDDGRMSLWVGAIDDLWRLGKPRGVGGPWLSTPVVTGIPSDPYLMTGYDEKSFELSHDLDVPVVMTIEVDATGEGHWRPWSEITVDDGVTHRGAFPEGFQAYWVRAVSSDDCNATFQLTYR